MNPTEKIFLLPESIRASLLGYLMERPYKEVANGIKMLGDLKEFAPVNAVTDKPTLAEVK